MRLIDADAFDERVRVAGGMSEEELTEDFKDGVQAVLYMLSNQPTIHPEPHWIPVEQELPEEEKDVLVTVHFLGLKQTHSNGWNEHIKESYYVEVASHINGEWSSASDEYKIALKRHEVIAWCELPEPYKEVTDGRD